MHANVKSHLIEM